MKQTAKHFSERRPHVAISSPEEAPRCHSALQGCGIPRPPAKSRSDRTSPPPALPQPPPAPARGVSTEKHKTQQNSSAIPRDSYPGEKQTNREAGGWERRGPLTYLAFGRHRCAETGPSWEPLRGRGAVPRPGRGGERSPDPAQPGPLHPTAPGPRPPQGRPCPAASRGSGTADGRDRPDSRGGSAARKMAAAGRSPPQPQEAAGALLHRSREPGPTRSRRLQLRPGAQLLPAAGLPLPGPQAPHPPGAMASAALSRLTDFICPRRAVTPGSASPDSGAGSPPGDAVGAAASRYRASVLGPSGGRAVPLQAPVAFLLLLFLGTL